MHDVRFKGSVLCFVLRVDIQYDNKVKYNNTVQLNKIGKSNIMSSNFKKR